MNTSTRSVSFVENLQLEISDNLFREALLLADVDNDGDNELVVGQINGELLIFKGGSTKPWRKCVHLGMITCVGVGDLWNEGDNLLVCITAEGWCHIFYITPDSTEEILEPISSQFISSNCRMLLIEDVDGDGMLELVTGHADRAVYIHRLEQTDGQRQTDVQNQPSTDKEDPRKKSSKSDTSPSLQTNKQDFTKEVLDEQGTKMTTQKPDRKDLKQHEVDTKPDIEQKMSELGIKSQGFSYRLVTHSFWILPCQIGSLGVFDVAATRHLLASYPGGTYAILTSFDLNSRKLSSEQVSSSPASNSIFKQLPLVYGRNKDIPTNLITLKCRNSDNSVTHSAEQDQTYLALCTQDGHLILMNGNKLQWSLRIDQACFNLFALSKLDITNDGNEELAACTWDGDTFIIDHLKHVVQFKFGENVMAFCAGSYAFSPGRNLPSLVYVTSCNRVVIFWNAGLSLMVPTNLRVKMRNNVNTRAANQDKETFSSDNNNDFPQQLF